MFMRFVVIIFFLFGSLAQAQVMQWSTPTRLKGPAVYTKVLGENGHGVFLLRYQNRVLSSQILVDKYQHHLQYDRSQEIDVENGRLVKVKMLQKGILIIVARFTRKVQGNQLFAHYMSYDLEPLGEEKLLSTVPVQEFGDRGDFRVRVSDDERFISVVYTTKESGDHVKIHWQLYDSAFNLIRTNAQEVSVARHNLFLENFMVSDSGDTYMLVNERKEEGRRPEFIGRIIVQEKDSVWFMSFDDSLKYRNYGMTFNRDRQEVVVACFYGQNESYGSEGILSLQFNIKNHQQTFRHAEFSEELIKELNLSRNKSTTAPEGFEFLSLVPRSDGGLLLVAEQKEIDTENDVIMLHGIPTSTSKNIYNYNDILAINLDSTGYVEWFHVIHKNQTTVNDGGYYSSAIVFIHPHFIQIIYNDQVRSTGEVMQHTLYSNGKIKSGKLLKSEVEFVVVIPVEASQVSSNKLIVPTSKNRRFALLKLIYD